MHPTEPKIIESHSLCVNPSCCPRLEMLEGGSIRFVEVSNGQSVTLTEDQLTKVLVILGEHGRTDA